MSAPSTPAPIRPPRAAAVASPPAALNLSICCARLRAASRLMAVRSISAATLAAPNAWHLNLASSTSGAHGVWWWASDLPRLACTVLRGERRTPLPSPAAAPVPAAAAGDARPSEPELDRIAVAARPVLVTGTPATACRPPSSPCPSSEAPASASEPSSLPAAGPRFAAAAPLFRPAASAVRLLGGRLTNTTGSGGRLSLGGVVMQPASLPAAGVPPAAAAAAGSTSPRSVKHAL